MIKSAYKKIKQQNTILPVVFGVLFFSHLFSQPLLGAPVIENKNESGAFTAEAQTARSKAPDTFSIQFEFNTPPASQPEPPAQLEPSTALVPMRQQGFAHLKGFAYLKGLAYLVSPIPRRGLAPQIVHFGPSSPEGRCLKNSAQTCVSMIKFADQECADPQVPQCHEVVVELIDAATATRLFAHTDYYTSGINELRISMEWELKVNAPMIYHFVPNKQGKFENLTMTVLSAE